MPLPTPPPSSPIAKYSSPSRDQLPSSIPDDFTKSPIFPPSMPDQNDSSRSPSATTTDDNNTTELRDSKSTIMSYKTAPASPSLVSPSAAYGPFTPTTLFTHDSSENLLSLREALAMKCEEAASDNATPHREHQDEDRDFAAAVFNKIGQGWGGGIQNGNKMGNGRVPALADNKMDWNEHTYSLDEPIENYFPASPPVSSTTNPRTAAYNTCGCAHDRASKVVLVGISGAPAHGRKRMLDILCAVFRVMAVVSQDDYQIAPRAVAPCASRPPAITRKEEEPPAPTNLLYNFDVEKLRDKLITVKAQINVTSASQHPEYQHDDPTPDQRSMLDTIRTLPLTLRITPYDRIALVEGPYLYSAPSLIPLFDVRLQILERKFLPWEDSFVTWHLRENSSPGSDAGWGPQLLETAVWRAGPTDYDMRLRTARDLARDLGISAEAAPVPVYADPTERLAGWAVRCVAEGVGRREALRQEFREDSGGGVKGVEADTRSRAASPKDTQGAGRGCWSRFLKWSCVLVGAGVVSRVLVGKACRR